MKPISIFYIRAQQPVAFSNHAEIEWGTDAIKTVWAMLSACGTGLFCGGVHQPEASIDW